MALTNCAKQGTQGKFAPLKGAALVRLDVDFDNNYTGGYASFVATTVKGVSGLENITVEAIPDFCIFAGGKVYICHWIRSTDVLEVWDPATGGEAGGGTNLAAYTNQEFVVFYQ